MSSQTQSIPVIFDPSSLIDDIELKPDYSKTNLFDCLIILMLTGFVVYGSYMCLGSRSSSPRDDVTYYEDSRRNPNYHDVSYRTASGRGYYN